MKKILTIFILMLSFIAFITPITLADKNLWKNWSNNCSGYDFDKNWNIWEQLDKCLKGVELVDWTDVSIEWWFWVQIKKWTNNIWLYLWVLAVWSIIFGWFMMTMSAWEEEKVKKWKDVIKWWIIWFLWVVWASAVINLIVKIMYSI